MVAEDNFNERDSVSRDGGQENSGSIGDVTRNLV